MNDLDLVRTMRADAPIPSRQRLDGGRDRLLAAIDSPSAAPRSARPRRRRGVLLAGGLAAVAAGAAAVVAVQADGSPVSLHGAPAAESVKYADPLVERAAFGWLPGGLHANGYVADHQNEKFFQVVAEDGKAGGSVTLTAYDRGKEPALGYLPGGVPAKRVPAAAVNGHRAYWIFKPSPSGQSSFKLRWQYAEGAWADLEGDGLRGDAAALTRTAYRIAGSATFGGARPIAMPLHVDGVPAGLSPDRTVLNNGAHGEVGAIVGYYAGGPSSSLGISVTKSDGTVGADAPGKPGAPAAGRPRPNTKLRGYPAYQAKSFLLVYGVNGFDVQIDASGSVLAKVDKTGGVAGLFRRMTVFGPDPANWTTNPVN
ncbi:hypothetical protein [Actinomadura verrucosospora]|uniref:Uncharacterized protein n=1 Tax=Actinomadura verrucosospora TaxID=46165 RepID=A0A7D4A1A3_ACTVE|nr:hypothetical protein [Actinomadura verrucosospora]QKG23324.1 hypothetical protein ACTIVE_4967 [Actinomadura verrucosospora]